MEKKRSSIETHDELCDALFNPGEWEDPQPAPGLPEPQPASEVHGMVLWLLTGLLIWVVGIAAVWVCW